jgi:hypothetical protein
MRHATGVLLDPGVQEAQRRLLRASRPAQRQPGAAPLRTAAARGSPRNTGGHHLVPDKHPRGTGARYRRTPPPPGRSRGRAAGRRGAVWSSASPPWPPGIGAARHSTLYSMTRPATAVRTTRPTLAL